MDIQVSSNHERLLFELLGRDGAPHGRAAGRGSAGSAPSRRPATRCSPPRSLDDDETLAVIRATCDATACSSIRTPRSASAPPRAAPRPDAPMVCLATAHPAKFPDAVERATGVRPPLPERLADLFEREERYDVVANDLRAVQAAVRAAVGDGR